MILIENISLFLGLEKSKLKVSNFKLTKGLWALVGRNGAGKSTFLNAVSGLNSNFEGDIKLNTVNLNSISTQEKAKLISVVFSKSDIFGSHTALDVLNLGRIPYQGVLSKLTKNDKAKVNEVVMLLSLESLLAKSFSILSDGEKQLVMIGRALVQDTQIILLDEPTAFLDVVNRKKIIGLLAKITKETDKLILFSTHNLDLVHQFCNGLLMIKNNELITVTKTVGQSFDQELEKLFEDEI